MEITVLHAHGWSVSRLAREFGLGRTSIRRELASEEPRRYPQRSKPTALSEAQRAHVERRLAMCPALRGSVLYHELCREYGYVGSYPAFIRHLRALRPLSAAEPVVRFETAPGVQVQADWAHLAVWPLEEPEGAHGRALRLGRHPGLQSGASSPPGRRPHPADDARTARVLPG